jgi:hypothetical protein
MKVLKPLSWIFVAALIGGMFVWMGSRQEVAKLADGIPMRGPCHSDPPQPTEARVDRLNLLCRVDGNRIEFSWDGTPEVLSIAVPFLSVPAEGVVAQGRYYIADSLSDDGFDVYEFDGLLERAAKGSPARRVRFLIGFPDGSSRVIHPVSRGWLTHRPNVAHFTYEEGGEPISIDLEMEGLNATFTCNEKAEAPSFMKYLKVEIVSK